MTFTPNALTSLLIALALSTSPAHSSPPSAEAAPTMPTVQTSALPPGAIILQRATIPDPGIIAKLDALTVLVPEGWATRGGIVPQHDPCSEAFGVDWSATSPDGRSTVFIFPTEGWQASTTPVSSNCPYGTFSSAEQYLVARVRASFRDARITAYRPREDYAKAAIQQAQDTQTLSNQMGFGMRAWADGGEMEFTFTGQDGAAMHGIVAVTATFLMSEPLMNPLGGPPLQSISGTTLGTFGAIAPKGELNKAVSEAVRRSIAPKADWLEKLFALKAQLGQMAVRNTEERAAMIVAGGAAATKRNIETYRTMAEATRANGLPDPIRSAPDAPVSTRNSTDETDDRIQRESIEAIRGVETYHDPVDGSQVQLDATYDNAWRVTNQDAYILTNDPNFNPGLYNIEATQLQTVK